MNYDDVVTFLEIYKVKTMSKASENLFVSQGTISSRISNLESKLGIKLFNRQPGVRHLSLSEDGLLFLPMAQKLYSTWKDAQGISEHKPFINLRIAASDQVTTFILKDFYKVFIKSHPNVYLTCQTEHATEIHKLIETRQMDLGLCFVVHNYPNVIDEPLYSEKYAFTFNNNSQFAKTHDIGNLVSEHEVFGLWSSTFIMWHQFLFDFYFQIAKEKR